MWRSGDTAQRHLSFLEQGRSKPGRTMGLRLAESLDVTRREGNELLLVADGTTLAFVSDAGRTWISR